MKKILRTFNFKRLSILSSLALSILLLVSFYSHEKMKKTEESSSWVSHTLESIALIESLSSSVFKMGNAQKFYIISRKKNYQEDFNEGLLEQKLLQEKLKEILSDNPAQKLNMEGIDKKISTLVNYYHQTIELMDTGKHAEAVDFVSTGKGVELLNEVSLDLQSMENLEKELLDQRLANERQDRLVANNFLFLTTLGGILIVLGFIYLAYRENNRREEAQRKLNRNAQVQKAILQAAAYGLIATDETGKITHFNPAAEKLLGYSRDEVMGKKAVIFHDPLELARYAEELSVRLSQRVPIGFDVFSLPALEGIVESNQWSYIRKDNTRVQVRLMISALTDIEGEITGFIAIANDISRQLESDAALRKAKEEAVAGTRAKSEFLANMSHEIRTPMNAILGMAELLLETKLDEEQRKYVNIFQSAGSGLLNIINDILDLSKIEAGHLELNPSVFSLSQIIAEATEIIAVKAHQKDLELLVDQESNLADHFLADAARLRQIILNLLGNAVKFTRKGEVILKITSGVIDEEDNQELFIEVRDTGIGMTEAQLKKLFQRFSQADSSITKEFGGTGLGLNITLKLVELMGGEMEVQSTYGVGTRFTVVLRLKRQKTVESEERTIGLKDLHFLVVDDNSANRLIVRKMLEHQGALVTEADGGEAAWEIIQQGKTNFSMMLIDGRMPQIDGFTLAERILGEDKGKDSLLMMLTSDNRPGEIARSREMGIKSLLVKPIFKDDLLKAIQNVLGQAVSKVEINLKTQTPDFSGLSILLVDDNEENRVVVKAFLKNCKMKITEAKNGEEALKEFTLKPYDLILMDMQMPVMDGQSAVREIRKLERERELAYTPIIALSAFALKEEIERSYEAGCNAHLTKPVAKKDLMEMMQNKTTQIIEVVASDMEDLVVDYLAARKGEAQVLSKALVERDLKTLQFVGHKLAGAAGSYGLMKLTEIGQRIESSARAGDMVHLSLALSDYQFYLSKLDVRYEET